MAAVARGAAVVVAGAGVLAVRRVATVAGGRSLPSSDGGGAPAGTR